MTFTKFRLPALLLAASIVFTACGKNRDDDPASKAPPAAQVESEQDGSLIQVDHPEQFPVTPAVEHSAASELVVTGSVSPDIERTVPVISVASGSASWIFVRASAILRAQRPVADAGSKHRRFQRVLRLPQGPGRRDPHPHPT